MRLNKHWRLRWRLAMWLGLTLLLAGCATSASRPVFLPESQRIYLIRSGSVLPTTEGPIIAVTDLWAVPSGEYLRLQTLGNCAISRGCE